MKTLTKKLRFKTNRTAKNGKQFDINIRLSDECKNGHQDFAITGAIYEAGKAKTDRNMISGGAIGDAIAKNFPEFEIFNRLHLCDCKGRPMYALENGRYHFTNTSFQAGKDYLRLTDAEANELNKYAESKEAFQYFLEKMGIVERWEKEANEAIELLEKLTDAKFINGSERYQYTPLSETEKTDLEQKDKDGYFSLDKMAERKRDAINKINKEIAAKELKSVNKMRQFAAAKEKAINAILNAGLPLQNCIFYDHSQSCKFNWQSYGLLISETDFNKFVEANKIDGFTFKIEK